MRAGKKWGLLATLTLFSLVQAEAAERHHFQYQAALKGLVRGVPVRVALPATVISKTSNFFSDLRIFDDQGTEVPYVVYPERIPPRRPKLSQLKAVSYEEEGTSRVLVLETPSGQTPINRIEIITEIRDFKKSVRVEASADRENWQPVGEGTIFDFTSRVNLRRNWVELPDVDARYLRLHFTDEAKETAIDPEMALKYKGLEFWVRGKTAKVFRIDRVLAYSGEKTPATHVLDHTLVSDFAVSEDKAGNSVIELGRVNLGMSEISLIVENAYFHRQIQVWQAETDKPEAYRRVTQGIVYRLPGLAKSETTLKMNRPQKPWLQLKVINGDNPPLIVSNVKISWHRQNLYFLPAAERDHALYFQAEEVERPNYYEMRQLIPNAIGKLSRLPAWTIGSRRENPQYNPQTPRKKKEQTENRLLQAVVLLLVVGLGVWMYRLIQRVR